LIVAVSLLFIDVSRVGLQIIAGKLNDGPGAALNHPGLLNILKPNLS
jgi:hypothetical protein